MYYISPVTYLIGGVLSAVLNNVPVVCSPSELVVFDPPSGESCGAYSVDFLKTAIGYLVNPNATTNCQYCPLRDANGVSTCIYFLTTVPCNIEYLPR